MVKKITKWLTNNPGLKIGSVVVAILLWLIVVNFDNPDITYQYNVPITTLNEDVLDSKEKVYEVSNQNRYAAISVTGKRKIMDTLSVSDFKATADFEQINFADASNEKLIPVNVTATRYANQLSIAQKTVNMKITLEDKATEQFYISVVTQGKPGNGYAIGDIEVSPNLIKISGPQSLVSQVKRVAAVVNVGGLTQDGSTNVIPVLYDEDGEEITSSQIKLSQDRVTANIQILSTKEVKISCETSGTPADGYFFAGLEYAPSTVMIKGKAAKLNNIYEITIPGEAINLEGATADVENSIDITPYLDELGVELVDEEENKVAVKATIGKLETKTLNIPAEKLIVLNAPETYEYSFAATQISVVVRGKKEELAALTEEQITATIELAGLELGDHQIDVQVAVPETFQIMSQPNVIVSIKEIVTDPEIGDEPGVNAPDGEDENPDNVIPGEEGSDIPDTRSRN